MKAGVGENTDPQSMDYPKMDYAAEVKWSGLENWVSRVPFRVIVLEKVTWNLIHSVS